MEQKQHDACKPKILERNCYQSIDLVGFISNFQLSKSFLIKQSKWKVDRFFSIECPVLIIHSQVLRTSNKSTLLDISNPRDGPPRWQSRYMNWPQICDKTINKISHLLNAHELITIKQKSKRKIKEKEQKRERKNWQNIWLPAKIFYPEMVMYSHNLIVKGTPRHVHLPSYQPNHTNCGTLLMNCTT